MHQRLLYLLYMCALVPLGLRAQAIQYDTLVVDTAMPETNRFVYSYLPFDRERRVNAVGIGTANLLDTYLSPEKYTGTDVRLMSQTYRWWKKNPAWWLRHQSIFSFQYGAPRADNSNFLGAEYAYSFAMRHEWCPSYNWSVEAGGEAEVSLGFLYSTRNSNNPAQAKARMNIGPSAATSFRFELFRRQAVARYEAYAPLLGVMFSPNYGQSYYEIFTRGNYDHNVVPTTVGCAPVLRHQLTLEIALRRSLLRIGYMGDMQQASVNNLKYHSYSHLFLIGFVRSLYRK